MSPINHTTAAAMKATILRIGVPCAQLVKKSPTAKITIKPGRLHLPVWQFDKARSAGLFLSADKKSATRRGGSRRTSPSCRKISIPSAAIAASARVGRHHPSTPLSPDLGRDLGQHSRLAVERL